MYDYASTRWLLLAISFLSVIPLGCFDPQSDTDPSSRSDPLNKGQFDSKTAKHSPVDFDGKPSAGDGGGLNLSTIILKSREVYLSIDQRKAQPEIRGPVYGVIGEWVFAPPPGLAAEGGYIMVVAFANGTSRLLFGLNSGTVGGEEPYTTQTGAAAIGTCQLAAESLDLFLPDTSFWNPEVDAARFTVLTENGPRIADLTPAEFDDPEHPLQPLFGALVDLQLATQEYLERK